MVNCRVKTGAKTQKRAANMNFIQIKEWRKNCLLTLQLMYIIYIKIVGTSSIAFLAF